MVELLFELKFVVTFDSLCSSVAVKESVFLQWCNGSRLNMGVDRKYAISLLSTMAVLVVIVHSEDFSPEYRHDVEPRALSESAEYDEVRRLSKAERAIKETTTEAWDDFSEARLKRRRRLRKRRPQSTTPKEIATQTDRSAFIEDAEEDISQQYVANVPHPRHRPMRRRKRPQPKHWSDDEAGGASRIVVQRKKKSHKGPRFTEFGDYFLDSHDIDGEQIHLNDHDKNNNPGSKDSHEGQAPVDGEVNSFLEYDLSSNNHGLNLESQNTKPKLQKSNRKQFDEDSVTPVEDPQLFNVKNDKSLSEFSYESIGVTARNNIDHPLYDDNKISLTSNNFKAKIHDGPIDPITLKEILKRSNGSSLSEILQQNNLTLADLLRGGENSINIFKLKEPFQNARIDNFTEQEKYNISKNEQSDKNFEETKISEDIQSQKKAALPKLVKETNDTVIIQIKSDNNDDSKNSTVLDSMTTLDYVVTESSIQFQNKRFYPNVRNKLRMRPVNSFKSQLNREFGMTYTRKPIVISNNTMVSKGKEWINIISSMRNNIKSKEQIHTIETTEQSLSTTTELEETTTETDTQDSVTESINMLAFINFEREQDALKNNSITTSEQSIQDTILTTELVTSTTDVITEKSSITSTIKYVSKPSSRRRQMTNRLKKKAKRQRHTTESPQNDLTTYMAHLSSNIPILKITTTPKPILTSPTNSTATPSTKTTQATPSTKSTTTSATKSTLAISSPKSTTEAPTTKSTLPDIDDITILDDFATTTVKHERGNPHHMLPSTIFPLITSTTEDTVKLEIEEILNDTKISANLARILSERNMSLNELFEHRERGSSHVHLADIFHNASREPNPPEPFLSKSFIEPISRETYPLKALLEANLHDPIKLTTVDPMAPSYNDIPVAMDFGNNVNENGESMGIVSLFDIMSNNGRKSNRNIDEIYKKVDSSPIKKDSEGSPYVSTVLNVPTDINKTRESRVMNNHQQDDSWNQILSFIHPSHNNFTAIAEAFTQGSSETEDTNEIILDRESDGDDVIVIENLHERKPDDSQSIQPIDKLGIHGMLEEPKEGILQSTQNNAMSVTVATASIIGLAFILFLLTYAAFKWKNHNPERKDSFCDRIPTPIFENRKSNRNSSMRSISPILSSNIYTLSTLETSNVKDTSDYNWDTNRKPFQ